MKTNFVVNIPNQAPQNDEAALRTVIDMWKREAQLTKLKAVRDMLDNDIAMLEGYSDG